MITREDIGSLEEYEGMELSIPLERMAALHRDIRVSMQEVFE